MKMIGATFTQSWQLIRSQCKIEVLLDIGMQAFHLCVGPSEVIVVLVERDDQIPFGATQEDERDSMRSLPMPEWILLEE